MVNGLKVICNVTRMLLNQPAKMITKPYLETRLAMLHFTVPGAILNLVKFVHGTETWVEWFTPNKSMEKLTFIIKVEKYTVIVMKVNFSIDLFGAYSKPLNPSLGPMHKFNRIQNGAGNCKMEYLQIGKAKDKKSLVDFFVY